MDTNTITQLKEKARIIRKDIINMLTEAKSGHPAAHYPLLIMVYLYFEEMQVDQKT